MHTTHSSASPICAIPQAANCCGCLVSVRKLSWTSFQTIFGPVLFHKVFLWSIGNTYNPDLPSTLSQCCHTVSATNRYWSTMSFKFQGSWNKFSRWSPWNTFLMTQSALRWRPRKHPWVQQLSPSTFFHQVFSNSAIFFPSVSWLKIVKLVFGLDFWKSCIDRSNDFFWKTGIFSSIVLFLGEFYLKEKQNKSHFRTILQMKELILIGWSFNFNNFSDYTVFQFISSIFSPTVRRNIFMNI